MPGTARPADTGAAVDGVQFEAGVQSEAGVQLEAGQRDREWFRTLTIPAGMWAIVRVDGRGFSRMTEERFDKPFDERLHTHMITAARELVADLGAVYGCTHSDEISVLLAPSSDLFGRSAEKLVSVAAGVASAAFSMDAGFAACFDARTWIGAGLPDVLDYYAWRQADATRSALGTCCYWTLRQAGYTGRQATAAMKGADPAQLAELLSGHGVSFGDLPAWQRNGAGLYWDAAAASGHDARPGQETAVRRRPLRVDEELPCGSEYRALIASIARPSAGPPARPAPVTAAGDEPGAAGDPYR